MRGRFLFFGIVFSVFAHAAILYVLSFSSRGTAPTPDDASVPIPEAPSAISPEPSPSPRPVMLPDVRATPVHEPAPTPEAEWVSYTVKRGDMLERLCKKAGCSVSEAARYNKTTCKKLSALKVGQKIKLPKFKEN